VAAAGAAHEQQRASRSHLAGGTAGDLEYQQEVLVEGAARLREVQVDEAPVVRPASCDHHVVDRGRQLTEEPLEGSRICGIEDRRAQRVEFARGAPQALGIPAGEDQLGTLSACSSGRFEPMPALPPITTTVCPSSSGSRWVGEAVVAVLMIPPLDQPNVNAKASTPGSRNSISNCRSAMGVDCRIS